MIALELLILLITSYGWGYVLVLLLRLPALDSLRFNLGFCLLPLLLLLMNLLGKVPLSTAAQFTFALSFGGIGWSMWRSKGSFSKAKLREKLIHPLFLLPGSLLILGVILGWSYSVRHWDEYTHWLLMPRQMFYFDQLLSDKFVVKEFMSYTPGWSITMIFPQLVWGGDFRENYVFWAPLLSCIGLFALVWDLLRLNSYRWLKTAGSKNSGGGGPGPLEFFCWVAAALIFFFSFGTDFFRSSTLIDPALKNMVAVLLIVMMFHQDLTLRLSSTLFLVSFILAAGYLYKKPFIVLSVPVAVFCGQLASLETTRVKRASFFILSFLASAALFLIVSDIWSEAIAPWGEFWNLTKSLAKAPFSEVWRERSEIFGRFFFRLLKLLWKEWFTTLLLGTVIVYLAKRKPWKEWAPLSLSLFIFYSAGLLYLYFCSYALIEALDLASFNRYMTIIIHPVKLVILLYAVLKTDFISWLAPASGLRSVWEWFGSAHTIKKLGILTVVIFSVWWGEHLIMHLCAKEPPLRRDVARLKELIEAKGLQRPRLQIISQKDLGLDFQRMRYWSFDREKVYFDLSEGWAFTAGKEDFWTLKVTEKEFRHRLEDSDVVWVIKGDEWVFNQLKQLPLPNGCEFQDGMVLYLKTRDGRGCDSTRSVK